MEAFARELEVAIRAVQSAGDLTLQFFGQRLDVQTKADASPVTIADRRAEILLREHLLEAFPDDGVLGEEHGEKAGRSGRRWIVDPIDGTQSFIRGVPLYGVLVGLEETGRSVVGVAGFPALGMTLWAATGCGAYRDGARIRVSEVNSLGDATVLTSDIKPSLYGEKLPGFRRLIESTARHRGWGDCYGYALVAMGRAEVMLDPLLQPWDAAAIMPIVEEAGGSFSDWSGRATIHGGSGVGTVRALRDEVLRMLSVTADLSTP